MREFDMKIKSWLLITCVMTMIEFVIKKLIFFETLCA